MYYVIFNKKEVRVGFTKEIPAESKAKIIFCLAKSNG
jgi:hypothetical protein